MLKPRFLVLTAVIVAAAISRVIPHPWNMTPVIAMALFAGARFSNRGHAFAVPLLAVFLSDMVLGFYPGMPLVYTGYVAVAAIGLALRGRHGALPVVAGSVSGSVVFFLITNFSLVYSESLYPRTMTGLMQSYSMAIPFFRNALAGDLLFSGLLFGAFALAERRFPALREPAPLAA